MGCSCAILHPLKQHVHALLQAERLQAIMVPKTPCPKLFQASGHSSREGCFSIRQFFKGLAKTFQQIPDTFQKISKHSKENIPKPSIRIVSPRNHHLANPQILTERKIQASTAMTQSTTCNGKFARTYYMRTLGRSSSCDSELVS